MGSTRKQYVPDEPLSRLGGQRTYSVEFVLNDYVQLRFDGDTAVSSQTCVASRAPGRPGTG